MNLNLNLLVNLALHRLIICIDIYILEKLLGIKIFLMATHF